MVVNGGDKGVWGLTCIYALERELDLDGREIGGQYKKIVFSLRLLIKHIQCIDVGWKNECKTCNYINIILKLPSRQSCSYGFIIVKKFH